MVDLRELYQEVILDHTKNPRNFHALADATAKATGNNPLCGDRVTVYLKMDGNRIVDAAFQGQGCAISKSSASLMTEAIRGRTKAEAEALFDRFHEMITGTPAHEADSKGLGKLAVFQGVSEFPLRVKCASLAWHTLKSALESKEGTVTLE
ncbi:MAG TPA: SUF system NifU family Fe-S cluster assembly protein [Thermoplasmata archaeon]|nr:SUF system NifU family Fe-S cluster assembly protein [Thermoplasmata archaeon]